MTRSSSIRFAAVAGLAALLAACGGNDDAAPADTAAPKAAAEVAEQAPEAKNEAAESETLAAVAESDGSYDADAVAKEGALRMARNEAEATPQRFTEGKHFKRFRPAKMTVEGGTGVEVAEVFWYGCNHCYNIEPTLQRWAAQTPENVTFVKVPAVWNPVLVTHAKVFYTIEALAGAGLLDNKQAVHMAFFDRLHVNRERMTSESDIAAFLAAFGVSEEDFRNTWSSPWVSLRLNQAKKLNQAYKVASVPTIVVNGKYVTDEGMAGGKPELVAVIDELVASER